MTQADINEWVIIITIWAGVFVTVLAAILGCILVAIIMGKIFK